MLKNFIVLSILGSSFVMANPVMGNPVMANDSAGEVPRFVQILSEKEFSDEKIKARSQKDMKLQLEALNRNPNEPKKALAAVYELGQGVCKDLPSFDSRLGSGDIKECRAYYETHKKQILSLDEPTATQTVQALKTVIQGKLDGKSESEQASDVMGQMFKSGNLNPDQNDQVKKMQDLYADPEFQKALQSGDHQKMQKLMQDKGIKAGK